MHDDHDHTSRGVERRDLFLEPGSLLASRLQRRVAVQCNADHLGADGNRVPAAATQLRKGIPPTIEATRLEAGGELMIAQCRVDAQMTVAPGARLGTVYIIVCNNPVPRQIP